MHKYSTVLKRFGQLTNQQRIERGQGVEALSCTKYLRFIFYLVIHKLKMKSIWKAHDQPNKSTIGRL